MKKEENNVKLSLNGLLEFSDLFLIGFFLIAHLMSNQNDIRGHPTF